MRKIMPLLCGMLCFAAPTLSQSQQQTSQQSPFRAFPYDTSEGWKIDVVYGNNRFVLCNMYDTYLDGVTLIFTVEMSGLWSLNLRRTQGFPANTQSRVDIYVDGKFVFGGPGIVVNNQLSVDTPITKTVLEKMSFGKTVTISTVYGKFSYQLSGTAKGIKKLAECALKMKDAPMPVSAPQSGPAPQPSQEARVPREKVLEFTNQVLETAGISRYKFLPPAQQGLSEVTWQLEDGTVGNIDVVPDAPSSSLEDLANTEISNAGKLCKGEFLSGRKGSRLWKGGEIIQMYASCRSGPASFSSNHSVIRRPTGEIVFYVEVRKGEDQLASQRSPNEPTEQAILSANFKK